MGAGGVAGAWGGTGSDVGGGGVLGRTRWGEVEGSSGEGGSGAGWVGRWERGLVEVDEEHCRGLGGRGYEVQSWEANTDPEIWFELKFLFIFSRLKRIKYNLARIKYVYFALDFFLIITYKLK